MALRNFRVLKTCKTGCTKRGRKQTVHYSKGEITELDDDNPIVGKWIRSGNLEELINENILYNNKKATGHHLK